MTTCFGTSVFTGLGNFGYLKHLPISIGESRNRTVSLTAASLNTLICKGIVTLILKGFKQLLALHATYRL